jgi:hypothetical protein
MAGVEHPHLMTVLAQNGRKRLDAQRREAHDLDARVTRLRAAQILRQQPVKVFIIYPDEEYFHKQEPFLVWQVRVWRWRQESFGNGFAENLPRADQLVIVIGFKSVLRLPQPKQAPHGSTRYLHSP